MAAAELNPSESRIEAEVRRARGLMEKRQFAPALAAAKAMLAEVPENRDVLYILAVCQRYLGRIADALATLGRLEQLHPQYARLFQERGHCHRACGDTAAAIKAYQRAVALNEALPATWKALHELLRSAGRDAEADNARLLVEHLAGLPPAIISASSLFAEGDVYGAERLVRQFLLTQPQHIEGMRLLGRIGVQLDVLDDAEFLFESVLAFAPDYHAARYDYGNVLSQRHKYAQALKEAEKLREIEPGNRNFRILYANACVGLGDHERALSTYRELLRDRPHRPEELQLSIAHALKTLGRQQEAIESYRAAAAAQPSFGDAYWSLANLKTYRFTDEELARMRSEEAQTDLSRIDRYHLCFALGKALEDRAGYAESFQYYERGNSLKKTETRYMPGPLERDVRLQISVCTREFFSARQDVGYARPDPIFVVGLPRAGSTLIEQILASHSRVEGTMELADIPRLVQHLNGRQQLDAPPRYPAVLPELNPEQLLKYGEKFIADTQVYRTGKPYFIDKMPNNFRHVGLIHLILPNAKIIDARREPMACCFSNFKQLFASGQEFTYSLEDLARYYRAYVQLMAHWDAVLPGRVLRVHHEELVEDLEHHVRRILDFVGLDFEPACLEFYKTERSIRTASSEQVRQPIYKEGIELWRNFEPWLEPLKAALGELAAS